MPYKTATTQRASAIVHHAGSCLQQVQVGKMHPSSANSLAAPCELGRHMHEHPDLSQNNLALSRSDAVAL